MRCAAESGPEGPALTHCDVLGGTGWIPPFCSRTLRALVLPVALPKE